MHLAPLLYSCRGSLRCDARPRPAELCQRPRLGLQVRRWEPATHTHIPSLFTRVMEGLAARCADAEVHEAPCEPHSHTQRPIVTGTSVLAVKYAGGIMMAADTLASYGGLARFKSVSRLHTVGDRVVLGAGGEYSDLQHILDELSEQEVRETCQDDGRRMDAAEVHAFLSRLLYQRRSKFNPLWNSIIVASVHDGTPFLGTVDKIGTAFTDDYLATGFGGHMAMPILRDKWRPDLGEGEARALLQDCMRVLFYRDCRTINKIQLAKVTQAEALISDPFALDTKWDYKVFVDPSGRQT